MKILLVDVDDTIFDAPKLWSLIHHQFEKQYPNRNSTQLQQLYLQEYDHSPVGAINRTIDAGMDQFGSDFWHCFYDTEFNDCLDHEGWQELTGAAKRNNIELHIFSEGATVKAATIPDDVVGFQTHKVNQLDLGLPAEQIHVYQDKLAALPELLRTLNPDQIGYVDDKQGLLDKAKIINPNITTHLITQLPGGLTELARMLE